MRMDIGSRLRDERQRLGLDQERFGEAGGVKLVAQSNYETGKRAPDAEYLAGIAAIGVDVQYVLTGMRAADPGGVAMDAVEQAVVAVHGMVASQALNVSAQQFAGMVLALLPKAREAEPARLGRPTSDAPGRVYGAGKKSQVIVGDSNVQIGRRAKTTTPKVRPENDD